MLSLTDEQKKVLMEQAGNFLQQVQQGKSARDIMAQIYVDGLDNKTLSQGQVMADAIMESVNAFDCDYAEAKDDLGAWLDRNLKQLAQGKTAAERCAMWMKIAVAVNAVSDQEHPVMTDDEKNGFWKEWIIFPSARRKPRQNWRRSCTGRQRALWKIPA